MGETKEAPGDWRAHPGRQVAILALTLLRVAVGLGLVVGLMFLVPDEPEKSTVYVVILGLALWIAYGYYLWHVIRRVSRATYPFMRAVEALILGAASFLALFAIAYLTVSNVHPQAFSEPLDRFTSYYFALTVLSTVGFGDITPVTTLARSITMVQMAIDLVFLAVLLRVIFGAARRAVSRRSGPDQDQSSG